MMTGTYGRRDVWVAGRVHAGRFSESVVWKYLLAAPSSGILSQLPLVVRLQLTVNGLTHCEVIVFYYGFLQMNKRAVF